MTEEIIYRRDENLYITKNKKVLDIKKPSLLDFILAYFDNKKAKNKLKDYENRFVVEYTLWLYEKPLYTQKFSNYDRCKGFLNDMSYIEIENLFIQRLMTYYKHHIGRV